MSVPLARPEPPSVEKISWPGVVVSVFGPGALEFAEVFAESSTETRATRVVRTGLRHAEGFTWDGRTLNAHPDALVDGLRAAREDVAVTVGVGAPFAVAVHASLTVWIRDGAPLIALPPALLPVASSAQLVLEEARPGVARELASALAV